MQMERGGKAGQQYSPDKIDFKTKALTRDREGQFIILKGMIKQENITLVNI